MEVPSELPLNKPLFGCPELQCETNGLHIERNCHLLSHPVKECTGDTLLVVNIHDRGMLGTLGVCRLRVFQGLIQHGGAPCGRLDVKADHVTDRVLTV